MIAKSSGQLFKDSGNDIFRPDEVDFGVWKVTRDKDGHYIMIKMPRRHNHSKCVCIQYHNFQLPEAKTCQI